MIVTIHQPEHLPWTGFFHKMMCADFYVYLDHVQYRKDYFQNRNKIVNNQGKEIWATIPLKSGSMHDHILDKETVNGYSKKYISLIESSYRQSKYFDKYFEKFKLIFKNEHRDLVNLNLDIIDFFRGELRINTPTVRSSNLIINSASSEVYESPSLMNLDICLKLNADSYIAGTGASLDYLDLELFRDNNVEVLFQNYIPPVYPSNYFYPGLSTLDLLFNQGENSKQIILDAGSIKKIKQ